MTTSQETASQLRVFNRTELTKRIISLLDHEEAVIAGIGNTNFDLFAAGHRPQNFYMLGSMGLACPIALGVAVAQPSRGVVALEGDGSILMGLGCLATIAQVEPSNLTIVIMDNGRYQITGGQPTTTSTLTDIVATARGMGIQESHWIHDEEHVDELLRRRQFAGGGLLLLAAKIDAQPGAASTPRDPSLIRSRFMKGLGVGRGLALEG